MEVEEEVRLDDENVIQFFYWTVVQNDGTNGIILGCIVDL